MGRSRVSLSVVAVVGLLLTGCGSGTKDSADAAGPSSISAPPPASASTSPTPSAVAPSEAAAPTGTLSKKFSDCAKVDLPKAAQLQQSKSGDPEMMCAFESDTDYVSFKVTNGAAFNFDMAMNIEKGTSNGTTVIKPRDADGWSFGATWPADGTFVRAQYWLVGKDGILLCKMGSDRGEAGITDLADVCEQAKSALLTA